MTERSAVQNPMLGYAGAAGCAPGSLGRCSP